MSMQVRSWLFLKLESHRQRSLCLSKHYLKTFSSIDSAFLFHEVWWDYWSCSPQISAVLMMVHYSTLRWRWTLDKNDSNWKPAAIFLSNQALDGYSKQSHTHFKRKLRHYDLHLERQLIHRSVVYWKTRQFRIHNRLWFVCDYKRNIA